MNQAPKVVLPLLLTLGACATPELVIPVYRDGNHCETICGLRTSNFPLYCDTFEEFELHAAANYPAEEPLCKADEGWSVLFVDGPAFKVAPGRYAYGETIPEQRLILLGTVGALPHELGHVLDAFHGVPKADSHIHKGWKAKGYCDAIAKSSPLEIVCEQ